MTSTALEEFGYAIREQRLAWEWSLRDLADKVLENSARSGYVSQIEKGQRSLSPETINKFQQAMDLPDDIVKAVHMSPKLEVEEPDEAKLDDTAERLLNKVAKDENVAPVAEALLTTLAYEFAGGDFRDLHTAYTSLRQALQAAEYIRKRGEMPSGNTGSQLSAVMKEVAQLNDNGALADADALLDAEEKRMKEEHEAEKDRQDAQATALLAQRLAQDRLRNLPERAAERLVADIRRQAPAEGLFIAVNKIVEEWNGNGDKAGDLFALQVALETAKINYAKAKGRKPLEAVALHSLAICHFKVAERSSNDGHLKVAKNASEAAVKMTNKTNDPINWSIRQTGLGAALQVMGKRNRDPALLKKAVVARRAALDIQISQNGNFLANAWDNFGSTLCALGEITKSVETLTKAEEAISTSLGLQDRSADPLDWEGTQSNLAITRRWLGEVTEDLTKLDEARSGYAACEELGFEAEAPFDWARIQWNIADLALARYRLDPDPAHLVEARSYLAKARAFFVEGSEYQTQRCDDLLAEIDAAEAA